MASKEVKYLFWKWSQEVLQEERFEKCRDVDKWAEYVRAHQNWKTIHNIFIAAVYEKMDAFEAELQKTSEGRERLIKITEFSTCLGGKFWESKGNRPEPEGRVLPPVYDWWWAVSFLTAGNWKRRND